MNNNYFYNLEWDKIFGICGIILSIFLILYVFESDKSTVYLMPGIFSLISCLIWFKIKNHDLTLNLDINESKGKILLLSSFFFLFLAFSTLSFYLRSNLYQRPLIYFVLISLMTGFVILEIFFDKKNKYTYFVLLQIITIGLSLIWTEQIIFPSVVGIDPAWHLMFTQQLLNSGHVMLGTAYSNIPLYHIEIAVTSILTNLNYKISIMFSISIIQIVGIVVFMFLIGKLIFNEKIGLITGLLVCTANMVILFGWWATPNSIAAVYIPIILYLLFKKENLSNHIVLVMILMFALILTHPVTSIWLLLLLFLGFFVSKIIPSKLLKVEQNVNKFSLTIFLFFSILMLAWWMYASGIFFIDIVNIISWGFTIDNLSNGPNIITNYSQSIPLIETVYNNAGLFIFCAFSLIGFLYIFSERNYKAILLALVAIMTLSIGFFSLITGKEVLNVRWWYFAQILLSPLVAVALVIIFNSINSKGIKNTFLVVFVCLLSFLMITSSIACTDNHTFSPNSGVRYAFTASEMAAASFFSQQNVSISSDFDYAVNPSSSLFANYYNLKYSKIDSIDIDLYNHSYPRTGSIVIIRNQIVENPFRLQSGIYKLNYDPNMILSKSFDKIYDSNSVTAYI